MGQSSEQWDNYQNCILYRLEDYVCIKQVETIGINRFRLEVKEGSKYQSNDPETTFQLQQQWQMIFFKIEFG